MRIDIDSRERVIMGDAVRAWGLPLQLIKTLEESGELIQAVCKMLIAGTADFDNLVDEIADVQLMLAQLRVTYGIEERVDKQIARKINRLEEMLWQSKKKSNDGGA